MTAALMFSLSGLQIDNLMKHLVDRWAPAPERLNIQPDELHIWRASLDIGQGKVSQLMGTLSADEIERAGRFHFKKDRDHFVVARGGLRDILSRYLPVRANELLFEYSAFGKPELDRNIIHRDLCFNVSHSHTMALIAVTVATSVGVDIEYPRDDLADEQIARRFFSHSEVETFLSLSKDIQNEAFFTCWTRKEAYIKGIGEGLSMPLDQFDVTLVPGEPAQLLRTRPDSGEAARWSLFEIYPGQGYIAAAAVQARKLQLKHWNWTI